MAEPIIQPSFAAGELSPTLYARVDLAKYHIGAAFLRNLFVDYRGGVSNRPGTEFVDSVYVWALKPRLIPFQYSTIQAYVLEFGEQTLRVIKNGAPVLRTGVNITAITLGATTVVTAPLHGATTNDHVYVSGIVGTTQLNGRTFIAQVVDANNIRLTNYWGADINSTTYTVWTSGGTVARIYQISSPYITSALPLLKYTQSADTITLTHPDYPPYELTRTAHDAWTFTAVGFSSNVLPPATINATASAAGFTAYSYTITTLGADGQESVASVYSRFTSSVDMSSTAGHIVFSWSVAANATAYNIYKAQPIVGAAGTTPMPPIGSPHGFIGQVYGNSFIDTNIIPDFTKTPPLHRNPFAPSAIIYVAVTAGGAGYTDATTLTVSDGAGPGNSAVLRPVVVGGAITAVIIENGGVAYATPSITASVGAGATFSITVGPSTGVYPSVVAYFQQRRVFAASTNEPQTLWFSQIGAFDNMDVSNPVIDSDAMTLSLVSAQVNDIRHMIAMPGGLIVLTSYGAWQISGSGQNQPVTPGNVVATAQSYNGCSHVPPIPVNFNILYVQDKGSVVRDLAYNFSLNIYTGVDITILSNHLFAGRTITEWAYAQEPFKIVWCVRDDGDLLSLTYLKEQDVQGWAHHDTQGIFESICSISEGDEDAVYVVVRRYINGQWVRYVERFASRIINGNIENAWFFDCGLQNDLTYPNSTLSVAAATGSGVSATTTSAVFTVADVGKVIRIGNGKGTVAGYIGAQSVTINITEEITEVLPNGVPLPADSSEWSMTSPITVLRGLDHFEGEAVKVMADGALVSGTHTVTGGMITLATAASLIRLGLGFTPQFQSLYLDIQGANPTVQSKRKKVSNVTVRCTESVGFSVGPTFERLVSARDVSTLTTGDSFTIIPQSWDEYGQVCVQGAQYLPLTILGLIPGVNVGDS